MFGLIQSIIIMISFNRFYQFGLAVVASALLASCASVKPCGEKYAEEQTWFQSKKFKEAKSAMDSLCERTADLETALENTESDLAASKEREAGLQDDLTGLQGRYDDLKKSSGAEKAQLSGDLASKEAELAEKEELLKNREARLKEMQEIIDRQDQLMNALSDKVKNALMGFAADELSVEMKDGKVYVSMSDKLLFKSASDAVEAKGQEALVKIAEVMNKNLDIDMSIEGHTDSLAIKTSRFRDNWDLSTARATSVVRILLDNGMDATRVTAAGKGEFQPKGDNKTKEGRALNRRTEIVLAPKLDELMKVLND